MNESVLSSPNTPMNANAFCAFQHCISWAYFPLTSQVGDRQSRTWWNECITPAEGVSAANHSHYMRAWVSASNCGDRPTCADLSASHKRTHNSTILSWVTHSFSHSLVSCYTIGRQHNRNGKITNRAFIWICSDSEYIYVHCAKMRLAYVVDADPVLPNHERLSGPARHLLSLTWSDRWEECNSGRRRWKGVNLIRIQNTQHIVSQLIEHNQIKL